MVRSETGERAVGPDWGSIRSAVVLVGLLVGLGVASAAVIGVLALAMAALMDQTLG